LSDRGQVLLDVREDDEWNSGHAPDAVHRPLGLLSPTSVPNDRPIIAVCRSGQRSGRATQALTAAGYDVRNLDGGMHAWAAGRRACRWSVPTAVRARSSEPAGAPQPM
jgi:rhodanese-related sulfurtransferase